MAINYYLLISYILLSPLTGELATPDDRRDKLRHRSMGSFDTTSKVQKDD